MEWTVAVSTARSRAVSVCLASGHFTGNTEKTSISAQWPLVPMSGHVGSYLGLLN